MLAKRTQLGYFYAGGPKIVLGSLGKTEKKTKQINKQKNTTHNSSYGGILLCNQVPQTYFLKAIHIHYLILFEGWEFRAN